MMKRHPLEPFSLISGTVLLLVACTYLVGSAIGAYPDSRLLVPLLLIGLGGAGLAATLRAQQSDPAAPEPVVAEGAAALDAEGPRLNLDTPAADTGVDTARALQPRDAGPQ